MVHRYALINGIRLHYVDYGSGPLVVLLHGFPEFWYAWRYQIPALAEAGYRVIALDQRGYNTSDKPRGVSHYRLERLVEDVLGLIAAAGESRAVVVGHDWGGAIAWSFAMRHPERVHKLVILNAPHPRRFLDELSSFDQVRRSWYIALFQLPWLPEWLIRAGDYARLEHMLRNDTVRPGAFDEATLQQYKQALDQPGALTAALNYYRAAFRCNRAELQRSIRRIDTRTLLIWGEQDRYLGLQLAEGLAEWVPHLSVERMADASHWVHAEVPDRVNALMINFLQGSR